MGRRSRSRQVEIFNFSFLDILACTIGLLIFIMVMVFILQSNSPVADSGAIIERKQSETAALRKDVERDTQIAQGLETELDQLRVPGEPDLTPQRDLARAARDAAKSRYVDAASKLADRQARLDEARLARGRSVARGLEQANADLKAAHERNNLAAAELAKATEEANSNSVVAWPYNPPGQVVKEFEVLFVDCHGSNVILLRADQGKLIKVGQTGAKNLDDAKSDFQRLVAENRRLDNSLVLFWIRPDGTETYSAALEQLPKPTNFGFEPADAKWSFEATAP